MSSQNSNNKTIHIPRPEEIVAHLSETIKGHDSTKRMLASAAYAHLIKCHAKSRSIRNVQSLENCLITGPTGSGKSAMMENLTNFLGMRVVTVLCSGLSPTSYKGKTCEHVLDQIEEVAVTDGVMTPTLCVWDEIDKIAYHSDDKISAEENAGVYKRMTQSEMLGIIQGIKFSDRPGLKLNHVLHVGCGAFAERSRRETPRPIGFLTPSEPDDVKPLERFDPEHFIAQGLMPELVGRFPRLGVMVKPDYATIREIITESKTSPFRQKVWHFEQHGTQLIFDDDALDLLAEMVSDHPTGVRAIQLVLNQILGDYEYEITRSDRKIIEVLRYNREAVSGRQDPIIIRSSLYNRPIQRTIPAPTKLSNGDNEKYFGIF